MEKKWESCIFKNLLTVKHNKEAQLQLSDGKLLKNVMEV